MGNWITALGIPEVFEGLLCCTTSALSASCSKCSVGHPRFVFSLFLFFATIASFLVLSPHSRQLLDKIPYFCTAVTTNEMCDNMVGFDAVYRICFSISAFHIIFAILMFNTTSTDDFRFKLHNGYWFVKLVLLVLIMVAAFHIPRHAGFGKAWMYAGLTGGFMFIIIQIMLIIDFAHSWSMSWAERVDSGNASLWYTALAFSTILIYSVAITMIVFFYLFFTDLRDLTKCRGNMFLITFNLSHCILASLISVLPQVQEEAVGSGLLQSSVVTLYTMYLTWCTLTSEPSASCNPLGDVILEYDKASGVNGQAVFDCVLMFALLIFACNVRAGTSKLENLGFSLAKLTVQNKYDYVDDFDESLPNNSGDKNTDGDEFVEYNYSFFHFVMFLASLQLMMVVTNWHSPDELADMKKLVKNWATVWIQLSASFLCVLFYIWAMVMPLLVTTWGSCLGLDYNRVPTEDEEHGRLQRRHEAMCANDDVREEFDARTNFAAKVDKTRQSTMDSGMFDTNATTTSYSRSASRASVRVSSPRPTHSEGFNTRGLEPSELIGDSVFDIASISVDPKDKEYSEEKVELRQSREPAVNTICGNAGIHNLSKSQLTNIEELNEMRDTSTISSCTQGRKSMTGIDVPVRDLSEKGSRRSRPPSRIVVKDRKCSSELENENLNRLKKVSISNRSDTSMASDGEKMIGRTRETSSEERSKSERPDGIYQPRLPLESVCARLTSKSIGGDRSMSSDERNKHSRSRSRAVERCRAKLSEIVPNNRPISKIVGGDRSMSSDEKNCRSRPCSRAVVTIQSNDCRRSSSEGLVNDRNMSLDKNVGYQSPSSRPIGNDRVTSDKVRPPSRLVGNDRLTPDEVRLSSKSVGNDRVTSDTCRPALLEMKQHMEWVKRLRKSCDPEANLRKENVLENQEKSEGDHVKIVQVSSLNKTNTVRECDSFKDKGLKKDNKDARKRESFQSEKGVNCVEGANETAEKNEDNFKQPSVDEHRVSDFTKTEPQAPNVSKEILRLQAKILKFQAKVVQTQQKILEIQQEEET